MNLTRRQYFHATLATASGGPLLAGCATKSGNARHRTVTLSGHRLTHPLAITMWDFSWLERRWPGAGYEDWDVALVELKARGYDAVRIDAYPHLIAAGADRVWEVVPCWNQQDWGSPAPTRVRVQPALNDFLAACARRGLLVGLSTWFREDPERTAMKIKTPEDLGHAWVAALDTIPPSLRRQILYVDLCNEWPLGVWAPFYPQGTPRRSPEGVRWMRDAIAVVRAAHPGLSYTFSFTSEYDSWREQDVSMLDFLEPHLWMTHFTDFYQRVNYHYERFDPRGYENLVRHAERVYREKPEHWQAGLRHGVALLADWSRASHKALITTECWAVVDYKDWPQLSWDWVRELCEVGVRSASATGRWAAMATSNFCGPQFHGMWREVTWHRCMTDIIHRGALPEVNP